DLDGTREIHFLEYPAHERKICHTGSERNGPVAPGWRAHSAPDSAGGSSTTTASSSASATAATSRKVFAGHATESTGASRSTASAASTPAGWGRRTGKWTAALHYKRCLEDSIT